MSWMHKRLNLNGSCNSWGTDDGYQTTEDKSQKSEVRSQITEDRSQMTEGRLLNWEVGKQKVIGKPAESTGHSAKGEVDQRMYVNLKCCILSPSHPASRPINI
jgi:hypothetical protein